MSNVCPAALTGSTVTVWPETVTFKKLYAWASEVGAVAVPHLEPLPALYDQPMASRCPRRSTITPSLDDGPVHRRSAVAGGEQRG